MILRTVALFRLTTRNPDREREKREREGRESEKEIETEREKGRKRERGGGRERKRERASEREREEGREGGREGGRGGERLLGTILSNAGSRAVEIRAAERGHLKQRGADGAAGVSRTSGLMPVADQDALMGMLGGDAHEYHEAATLVKR